MYQEHTSLIYEVINHRELSGYLPDKYYVPGEYWAGLCVLLLNFWIIVNNLQLILLLQTKQFIFICYNYLPDIVCPLATQYRE